MVKIASKALESVGIHPRTVVITGLIIFAEVKVQIWKS
jgi:hypothetical protein